MEIVNDGKEKTNLLDSGLLLTESIENILFIYLAH